VPSRISRLYPKFSESASSSASNTVGLTSLFEAGSLCLEKRLASHSVSDENFAKLKLALEQMHTTIERTEQVQKTLDHLEHLPKHIQRHDVEPQDPKTPFDQIVSRFYPSIDCGQQARELFREQMSKQAPNSFVTCCNTIVTISADESNSDFINDDTTIIRCQVSAPVMTDEGMLKGLECLLLSEPSASSTPMMTNSENDESFLNMEQECRMESDTIIERPRRRTILETNVAAAVIDDRMEEDNYSEKENQTPTQQSTIHELLFEKIDQDIQFISPIISVPIGQ
jgi:hypothetical protein